MLETTASAARLPLFRQEMRRSLRGLVGWTLGNAAGILLYLPFYPSIGASQEIIAYFESFPPGVVSAFGFDRLATGAGYTQSTYFALTAFLLFAIAAVSWGSAAVAGDEEGGGLELTLAHAVTRSQVVVERALAILVRVVCLAVSGLVIIWTINDLSRLSLTFGGLVAVSAALVALTLLVGMAALCAGALTGRRSVATATGAGVAVLAYILDAVARTTDVGWLGAVSPVRWAFGADPITTGLDVAGLSALVGVAVALLVVAVVGFRRRDIAPS